VTGPKLQGTFKGIITSTSAPTAAPTIHIHGEITTEDGKHPGKSHLLHRSAQDEDLPAWYASYIPAEQAGTDLPS
jgi:hypothetical protein